MKRALLITIVLLALLPDVVKAQWTFDVVSVEAYINDHKIQPQGGRRIQGTEYRP